MFPARVQHPFTTRRNGLLHASPGSRQALPGKMYAHTGITGQQARLWDSRRGCGASTACRGLSRSIVPDELNADLQNGPHQRTKRRMLKKNL